MLFLNVGKSARTRGHGAWQTSGDFESFREFVKLSQYLTVSISTAAIPSNRSTSTRRSVNWIVCRKILTLSDKAVHAYSLGAERVEDVMEMVRIAGGPHAQRV